MTNYDSGTSANGYKIRLTVTTQSQNTSKNESVLAWSFYIINPSNHFAQALSTGSVTINGSSRWSISKQSVHTGGAGQTKLLASGTVTVKHGSDGKASVPVAGAFGHDPQNGAGWNIHPLSVSGTYKPKDIGSAPKAPGTPTLTYNAGTGVLTATSPTVTGATGYRIRWRVNGGAWTVVTADQSRQISITPNVPDGKYQFQAGAKNAIGWSGYSGTVSYIWYQQAVWVRHSGTWKLAVPYVRHSGVWKPAVVYMKRNNVWDRLE